MIGSEWVAGIVPGDEVNKKKVLVFNEDYFDLKKVNDMAIEVWPKYLDYHKRETNTSSSSSSSTSLLTT
eukprot:15466395-Alexandrium_andersonii.AAC.1